MPYPHRYITLSPEERNRISRLLQELSINRQYRKRIRLQAIWLSDQKQTYLQISQNLNVTYQSVKMWIAAYRKVGLDEFMARMKK